MDSHEALKIVEEMVALGKVSRVSSDDRNTKGIIFRTPSGRNFAVEVNDVLSRGYAEQVKLIFERAPGGGALVWDGVDALFDVKIIERQFENSAYKVKGSNLEPGKQVSAIISSEQSLANLIDWYASALPLQSSIAERIRAYALSNYIKPARERGDDRVSIRAGTLHDELNLFKNWANVCQVLRGEKFRVLGNLSEPDVSGPRDSTTTMFTYHFEKQAIPMAHQLPSATNLILYGPPGTGKTYATAAEAVRLCLGDAEAAPLLEPGQREALMNKYRELDQAGRIDFVTFHQSYSYEDFVEGLRPTTDVEETPAEMDEESAPSTSGGFRLRSEDGIFKLICERARLDRGDAQGEAQLDRRRPVFKMSLGRRGEEEYRVTEGLTDSLVHLGYGGDIDWSDERFDSLDEIGREWREKKEPGVPNSISDIKMMHSFRNLMQVGDYVVLSDGLDTMRAFGIITGDYTYGATATYHPHRRKIDWVWQEPQGAQRSNFYSVRFQRHSISRLRPDTIDWDGLEKIVFGKAALQPSAGARPYVLVIDEINRANISKVFGELITLLEPDKRLGELNEIKVKLPYSDGPAFGVPANLHIIGTMNTADRSIALLDTALRRRFTFRELMPQPALLKPVDGIDLAAVLTTLNDRIEYLFDREHQIGHAYFIGCKTRADLDEIMRHKVIPLLAEYFYEDWNKVAAVLGDANDGEGNHAGGFLDRKKLACPRGMGGDGDAPVRFRWSVRAQFDYTNLVR